MWHCAAVACRVTHVDQMYSPPCCVEAERSIDVGCSGAKTRLEEAKSKEMHRAPSVGP